MIGYDSVVTQSDGMTYILFPKSGMKTRIVTACTGIGSMSAIVALIAISSDKKLHTVMWSVSSIIVIHALNTARNVFIAVSYSQQLFHIYPGFITQVFGNGGTYVSYYIADKIISQTFSLLFLVALAYLIFDNMSEDNQVFQEISNIIDYVTIY
jgi:archaeosortase A (PGF-CTERM-specific)